MRKALYYAIPTLGIFALIIYITLPEVEEFKNLIFIKLSFYRDNPFVVRK